MIHASPLLHMDFLSKSFEYKQVSFGAFMTSMSKGEKVYLRSVASEGPAAKPTLLSEDFPSIASDFQLPPELTVVEENAHSSPLRLSGPVQMWLHYDVGICDNTFVDFSG